MNNSSLPTPAQSNDKRVTEFFDKYFTEKLSFASNEVDAVIGYFLKRGFDKVSAVNTASILLQQAEIDQLTVFKLLDTLKGINDVQLSNVVAQILNLNRSKVSTLGYRTPKEKQLFDQRQIIV